MSEEREEKKIQVKDRRRFSEDRKAEPEAKAAAAADEGSARESAAAGKGREREAPAAEAQEQARLPEINFSTFVISLSSSVLIHLGLVPDPIGGGTRKELPLAKQTIDILAMLEAKTKGNLTPEEGELMEHLLFDLRMRYVEQSRKG